MSSPAQNLRYHEGTGGKIRGDEAWTWLRDNDPAFGREGRKRPVVLPPDPAAWLETFEDAGTGRDALHRPTIYCVQASDGGPVKIGWSNRRDTLHARLCDLQTGNPAELVLRRAMFGSVQDEHRLHLYFAARRIRGEWFLPDSELARFARAKL